MVTKVCYKEACSSLFYKPTKESYKQWRIRKYCSVKCSAIDLTNKDKRVLYKTGHKPSQNTKQKISSKLKGNSNSGKGKNHSRWRGGKYKTKAGYIMARCKEHPKADKRGYIYEHRLVIEKELGRYLKSSETVHHKNGNKGDNRIDNLEVCLRNMHYGKVCCPKCKYNFLVK